MCEKRGRPGPGIHLQKQMAYSGVDARGAQGAMQVVSAFGYTHPAQRSTRGGAESSAPRRIPYVPTESWKLTDQVKKGKATTGMRSNHRHDSNYIVSCCRARNFGFVFALPQVLLAKDCLPLNTLLHHNLLGNGIDTCQPT
jgi:hypothetical protein